MFGSLSNEFNLAKLDQFLKHRSYLGGYSANTEDYEQFEQVTAPPDSKTHPHAARWYQHVHFLLHGPVPKEYVSSAAPSNAPAKERKKKEAPGVDCVVLPWTDRKAKSAAPPPLGFGAKVAPTPKEQFYITTAISYTNGWPHIGHAYEALTTDIFARYHRVFGRDTYFLTGTDEHGQKIAQAAEDMGMTPLALCDMYAVGFEGLNQRLLVSSDFFVRTSQPKHEATAQELWKKCFAAGDIYFHQYEGWYLVREERFVTDMEAQEWNFKDPGSGKDLTRMKEPSFFFRASKYQQKLIDHIEANPDWIRPEMYRNQILARLKAEPLRDLSVSRGTFDWGIEVPDGVKDGKQHVMYVWFDALTNYVTGVRGLDKKDPLSRFWPCNAHVIGKDILWFHTVTWGSMLMSAGVPLHKSVIVHGFINGPDGRKMSKTYGNVINPHDELDKMPADTFRWYLAKAAPYGDDLRYSPEGLRLMHNADLLDTWGNLVHRATTLAAGKIPPRTVDEMPFDVAKLRAKVEARMWEYNLSEAAEAVMAAARDTNKWITEREPWKMKTAELEKTRQGVTRILIEAVYVLAHFFAPYIPASSDKVFKKLGTPGQAIRDLNQLNNLKEGTPVDADTVLFSIMEASAEAAEKKEEAKKAEEKAKPKEKGKKGAPASGLDMSQELLSRLDLRVGKIVEVWEHPEAERLFVEKIDVGDDHPRTIVSGLREYYTLEQMLNRLVVVICNLKPAKMRGVLSEGMVLASKLDGKVELVAIDPTSEAGVAIVGSEPPKPWEPNQVKKHGVWEEAVKDLRTNDEGQACFQGRPLKVEASGTLLTSSLKGAILS